ncbi:hypothetical protein GOP47_0004009 [Adiantum capillus-veneris]|uniref:Uncharacterized protein n=1 Tax=Adiantum capillus-veneris TaxID=13818 RepID=A0A9D4V7T9_ADICA|nr:hypothetical protein GOP47_0004009 [Adiantum capillus-veneris]
MDSLLAFSMDPLDAKHMQTWLMTKVFKQWQRTLKPKSKALIMIKAKPKTSTNKKGSNLSISQAEIQTEIQKQRTPDPQYS